MLVNMRYLLVIDRGFRHTADCVPREHVFLYDPAVDQMFLNDPFEHGRRTRMVPHAIGINYRDRAIGTNAQTVDFAPVNQRFPSDKLQLFESLL